MSDSCRICGKTEQDHLLLEADHIIHHRFSRDGFLEGIERPGKQQKQNTVLMVPGVDLELRALLIRKGLLDESDFSDGGTFGAGSTGNRPDRAAEGADGGLRSSPAVPGVHVGGESDPGSRGPESEPPGA